ncbi:MAG: signal peptidase II [Candidatus Muproteobacteria bacterium RIFCSPHIGHO2_02_FULL_65_16]|uniref:Lipoprotein signal peptidase n=1 Tax=Candidatus Muproteobacteria bacterium RIFCSPHIGHO2_02_FULL_65_16 TaxID=1817766 RepID=A0A1F6U0A0_9PROT|nr:MAG: signal peptidase II [Candidatus Muproteobacteria bacterium RIFCSPHIGHO2_02_FULL_65_16]
MWRYLWISPIVFVLDQASKLAAVKYLTRHAEVNLAPFLNLTLVYNTGAAFGFLNDAAGWQNIFFIIVALVAGVVILFMLRRLNPHDAMMAVGLTLILGGAAGNLADRLIHGYVIDFIDVYYGSWHWPAFNIADTAITVGAVLLVLDALGFGKKSPR